MAQCGLNGSSGYLNGGSNRVNRNNAGVDSSSSDVNGSSNRVNAGVKKRVDGRGFDRVELMSV
ncbi:conserved hypothetical protein [Ricinus communis]|uniref:Uncharacterized protein n=1 Tax=Ricinus communis TaxID=3988 RepID=B9RR51_RICCO|nr:conserved hypothetical protein [Ricinus communis]